MSEDLRKRFHVYRNPEPLREVNLPPKPSNVDGAACPKCGYTGEDRPKAERDQGWKKWWWCSPIEAARFGLDQGECIMVRCARCAYRWWEPVVEDSLPSTIEESAQ